MTMLCDCLALAWYSRLTMTSSVCYVYILPSVVFEHPCAAYNSNLLCCFSRPYRCRILYQPSPERFSLHPSSRLHPLYSSSGSHTFHSSSESHPQQCHIPPPIHPLTKQTHFSPSLPEEAFQASSRNSLTHNKRWTRILPSVDFQVQPDSVKAT